MNKLRSMLAAGAIAMAPACATTSPVGKATLPEGAKITGADGPTYIFGANTSEAIDVLYKRACEMLQDRPEQFQSVRIPLNGRIHEVLTGCQIVQIDIRGEGTAKEEVGVYVTTPDARPEINITK